MKKFLFALLGVAIIVISGCVPIRKTSATADLQQQSQGNAQPIEPKNLVVYTENIPVRIEVGLSNNLFVSSEVRLEGDIHQRTLITHDGSNILEDSIIPLRYVVPQHWPGELTTSPIRGKNGRIVQIDLSFEVDDASFDLDFRLRGDGTFILNGNATITYYGIPYDIHASSVGECILLIDYTTHMTTIPAYKVAKGRKASGDWEYKVK